MFKVESKVIKDIWIYGTGGVGGYFGGLVARAIHESGITDKKVVFIARGRHLEAIKKSGLILNTSRQPGVICRPSEVTDSVDDLESPDLCLVCVKSYDLNKAAQALAPKVKSGTIIMPLLNGVDIYERVRGVVQEGIVLKAVAYVGTHVERPGVVTQQGADGVIHCGPDPRYPSFRPEGIANLLSLAAIPFTWLEDPDPAIWAKYLFIAPYALVTASEGKTLGEVYADEALRGVVRGIIAELHTIARKKGIYLSEQLLSEAENKAGRFPFDTKTSYQRDVETKGKPNEGDLFAGAIIRYGEALDVPTPVTRRVFEKIQMECDL